MGKKATIFKAQCLYGNCGRKCGGYKWEGHAHYLGRSAVLPLATCIALEDYNAMQETTYLLRSPVNARNLLESIAELEAGNGTERELIE